MNIKINTRLENITVTQLIAYADLDELLKIEDRTKEVRKQIIDNMGIICDFPDLYHHLMLMPAIQYEKSFNNLLEKIAESSVMILQEYAYFFQNVTPVIYFHLSQISENEIEAEKHQISAFDTLKAWVKTKWYSKQKRYYVAQDPSMLPTDIWLQLLDDHIKPVSDYKPDETIKQFKHIPFIVAALSWQKGEDMFVKSGNNYIVNAKRIEDVAYRVGELNAKTATQIVAFFFHSSMIFLGRESLNRFGAKSITGRISLQKNVPTFRTFGVGEAMCMIL